MIENAIYSVLDNFEDVLINYTNGEDIDFEYISLFFTQVAQVKRMLDLLPKPGKQGDLTEILTEGYGTRIEIEVIKALNNAVINAKNGTLDDYHITVLEEQIVKHHGKRIEV